MDRLVQQGEGAAFVAIAALGGELRLTQGFLGVGELLLLVFKRGELVIAQGQRIQLFDLITQQLAPGL